MGNKINPLVDSIEETPRLGGEATLKKGKGKISVVVTVKEDPEGERKLMEALAGQTVKPDEVIIVESSNRETPWHTPRSHPIFARRVFSVGCSRGRGRNIGVRMAKNEFIAVTDAGCRPHRDWLEKLTASFQLRSDLPRSDLGRSDLGKLAVAGWYRVAAKTQLQQIMAHFLVPVDYFKDSPWHTPGRILSTGFLPASRSIMFTKKVWELVGGYPEEAVSGAEDLEFARRLVAHPEVEMIYCPEAVVDWEPPATLREFFRDIVKHTRGNVEVGYRPHLIKNFTVVLRWMIFLAFPWMIPIYLGIKIIKIIMAIKDSPWLRPRTVLFIPIVQLAADGGVIWGLISGILGRLGRFGKFGKLGKLG